MTTTHPLARFLVAAATVTGLALLAVGCGSSSPKATPASSPSTTVAPAAADPVDSPFCVTSREWLVHDFDGEGNEFEDDPPAFKKYWTEYMSFIHTAGQQAPPELEDQWPVGYRVLDEFTPVLEKYDYDIARAKAEGTPAELALGARLDAGPNPKEQAAQDKVHEYQGRVCQTSQPPAAEVSFDGAKPNQAYCDTVAAGDEAAGEVAAEKWSVDAVRSFVTSDTYRAALAKLKANAPAEIKADVLADADWQGNEVVDVLDKYGYDVRKLFLDGSPEDRATFQRSDPAIADHYARTLAYEEQVCGEE